MQHCIVCGSVSSGCTLELQSGKKTDRPRFICKNGKTFGNWYKVTLVKKSDTPRLVKCNACLQWQWNFNLQKHYNKDHPKTPMEQKDQEICKEFGNSFARKHIQKHKTAKSYDKAVQKSSKPKSKKKRENKVVQNRLKKGANVLDMLMQSKPSKKKRKKNSVLPPAKRKRPVPKPKKKVPFPKPKPNPKSDSNSDYSMSDLDAPPQKRRKVAADLDPDFTMDDDFDDSSSDDNVFTRERARTRHPTSHQLANRGSRELDKWEGLL